MVSARRFAVQQDLQCSSKQHLVEGVEHDLAHARVAPVAVNEQQAFEETKLGDGVVARIGRLEPLTA